MMSSSARRALSPELLPATIIPSNTCLLLSERARKIARSTTDMRLTCAAVLARKNRVQTTITIRGGRNS